MTFQPNNALTAILGGPPAFLNCLRSTTSTGVTGGTQTTFEGDIVVWGTLHDLYAGDGGHRPFGQFTGLNSTTDTVTVSNFEARAQFQDCQIAEKPSGGSGGAGDPTFSSLFFAFNTGTSIRAGSLITLGFHYVVTQVVATE